MKNIRIISFILVLSMLVILSSCSAGEECRYENFMNSFIDSEDKTAFVYENNTLYDINDFNYKTLDVALFPMEGTLTETSTINKSDKLLTITVAMQYEMTFFENGGVMIYHGVCGVFEKDRQYYEFSSDYDVDFLINYIKNNFSVSESEE